MFSNQNERFSDRNLSIVKYFSHLGILTAPLQNQNKKYFPWKKNTLLFIFFAYGLGTDTVIQGIPLHLLEP